MHRAFFRFILLSIKWRGYCRASYMVQTPPAFSGRPTSSILRLDKLNVRHAKLSTMLGKRNQSSSVFRSIFGNVNIGFGWISIAWLFGYGKNYKSIDERLKCGSRPVLPCKKPVNRPYEIELVQKNFILQKEVDLFGVVLGPSGTGKTFITRQVCNEYPSGVLYYEIDDHTLFPQGLAREIKMKLKGDINFFDLIIEKMNIKMLINFFKLPKDTSAAMTFVLRTLAERAEVYKQKYGVVPCLFIDGVDLVAKKNPDMFKDLVDRAKLFANSGTLLIVLVSSEGSVVPLLDQTSSTTRRAKVIEILDVSREDSYDYLREKGIPEGLLAPIYNFAGGRFIFFNQAAQFYHTYKQNPGENDVFTAIQKYLSVEFVEKKVLHMHNYSMAEDVMKRIVKENRISYIKLIQSTAKDQRETMRSSIEGLTRLNLLRYTADGDITWHSELVRNVIMSDPENYLQ